MIRSIPARRVAPAIVCALLVCSSLAAAPAASAPGAQLGDAAVGEPLLTGREIYDRVLTNRFDSYRQSAHLVSGDRAGNEQESRMQVTWKSFRDGRGDPRRGVLSKSLIRYTHPFDLRFSGYLIINNHERIDDQFVYLASRRRVRRVNLRGEPVLGSDFSFEDVVPHEIEEAEYRRLPDEVLDGKPCYRVEVIPDESADSEYSHFRAWVEKEHHVVLRSVYWDRSGVRVKELRAPASEIREFEGVWVAMRTDMTNLQLESYSRLLIDELVPNPTISNGEFDPRRLESH